MPAGRALGRIHAIGFTSVFKQNIPSLALAAQVKQAHPATTIAFGGANREEVMGVSLQEQFSLVDLAFSGEADESFPWVLEARARGEDGTAIVGVSVRVRGEGGAAIPGGRARTNGREVGSAGRVRDLDQVPVPDFDPYFTQKRASCAAGIAPSLLAETARMLVGRALALHLLRPQRRDDGVPEQDARACAREMRYLRDRYQTVSFSIVDDILDLRYFRSVLPALAGAGLGIEFFWEVKANLTHDQVPAPRRGRAPHPTRH